MRLFAAVVPPPAVLDHLEAALDQVIPVRLGGRNPRTPRAGWHITLAFFGSVPDGCVPALAEDFAAVVAEHGPFRLELSGAGTFGGRTAWIGVGGEVTALKGLAGAVRGLWDGPGDGPGDGRGGEHKPHLTVSRRVAQFDLRDPMKALAVYRGPSWEVTEAILFESRLGHGVGGSALYVPLAAAALSA
jgi:2'-5' RNA ligase